MPMYHFKNKTTEEIIEPFVPSSEYDEFVKELGDDWERVWISAPSLVSQQGSTLSKTSDGWKEVLKRINKSAPGNNTVNN